MVEADALAELTHFAESYAEGDLLVRRAAVALDERQDGELVTRVLLLLTDPPDDTWEVDRIRELRSALGRKATELELPSVTLTLVAESEAEAKGAFAA
ncbi:MAG: hypothetical protein ACYCUM_08485 [Solirubrobacteraceae bacterium]